MRSIALACASLALLLQAACATTAAARQGEALDQPPVVEATAEDLRAVIERPGAAAVLVNLWASWCEPCMEELPEVLRLREESIPDGVRVVLVSFDVPSRRHKAVAALRELGVTFPTFIREGGDQEFVAAMHPWRGRLPTTMIFGHDGALRELLEGKQTYEALRDALDAALAAAREDQP